MKGHAGVVRDCDISADGRWLVSGSFDKTLRVWSCPQSTPGSPA
ncbi:MAG: WD40 repeat domain-containing protein [Promethearchaeia archaeon]